MFTSVRGRLIVLIAVAILPLVLLAGAGLYLVTRHQDEQGRRVGLELARSVANAVNTELRGAITILQTLATAPSLDRDDVAAFRERATRIVALQQAWAAIIVADPAGNATLDTRVPPDAPPLPIVDQDSLRQVIATRQPAVGRLTEHQGEWLFPVRVPVMRDGELRQVITALMKPDAIRDVIVRQQIADDWVISILDGQGLRVARSRAHDDNLGGRLSESAQRILAAGGPAGEGISISLEGNEIFTPYSSIEPFGWRAVLGIPTTAFRAASLRSLLAFGGGVVLSILIGTLAAGWVARGITGPIGQLRMAADALGRREIPQAPESPLPEVRNVGDALKRAADELARYEVERDELLRKERSAREAAERADRAKDEFMAVLSHELRTPLNAVYGWARLLQSNQLHEEQQIARAKDAIVRNSDAQVRLIDELLDLSRISSGKMPLAMQPVHLKDVRQGALDAIRPSADDKGIRIAVMVDADADGTIVGDGARLQQIIWNLLANAVKFTGSGGEILLRQQRAGGHVEITVSDTGQGIAADMLPYVFDRFRQGDSSSTRSHRGLGLGLALVKELVSLHGGTVSASSQGAGLGSTFTVRLPLALEQSQTATVNQQPAFSEDALRKIVRLDAMRIVVVDDEPDARALAETVLLTAGADVRTCASAAAAIEAVKTFNPQVIVSDLEMPDEDGYSLIGRLRALPAGQGGDVPAIALSAYGRPQDRERALAAGFNMHVPKPVDPGELTAIVASVAGRPDATGAPDAYGNIPSSI